MKDRRINVYVCQYGCNNVTIDVDEGVTPSMIKCRSKSTHKRPIANKYLDDKGECIGRANSSMYPRGPKPKHINEPTHEWYTPNEEEINSWCAEDPNGAPGIKSYYDGKHLSLRERTDRKGLYHE